MKTFTLPNSLLKSLCFTLLLTALSLTGFAQMKIGDNPTQIHKASILELESGRQGLLLTKIEKWSDINSLINTGENVDGMIVYYTGIDDEGPGLYVRKDNDWVKIASASDAASNWSLEGNAGTNPGTAAGQNYLGTSDGKSLVIATNGTPRMTIAGDGTSLIVDPSMISTSTTDLEVLVLKADGTILKRAVPEAIFQSVITAIKDKAGNSISNAAVTFSANASNNINKFEVVADGSQDTISVNAPIMDATAFANNVPYGFMTKTDWDKLNQLQGIYSLAIGALTTDETDLGATIEDNDGDGKYEIHLVAADATHSGIVKHDGTQTFGGNKIFNGDLTASSTLTVTGTSTLNGQTTVNNTLNVTNATTLGNTLDVVGNTSVGGTLGVTGATTLDGATTINNTLDVTGNTTIGGTMDITGTTTLGSVTDAAPATNYNVLVLDGTEIQKTTISADAGKSIVLGSAAGTDPSNGTGVDGLNIVRTGTDLTINVPDADATVRGVVNRGDQTFGGNKTFKGNTTVGNGTDVANLVVENGTTTLKGETTIGTTGESANLTVNGGIIAKVSTATGGTLTSTKSRTFLVDAGSGSVTITLPSGLPDGIIYTFKISNNPDLNDVIVETSSGESFGDGHGDMHFYNKGGSRTIQKKGTTWYIISQ